MTAPKYRIPEPVLQNLVRVALSAPDRMYLDAMGRDYGQELEQWKANLRQHLHALGADAWAQGATWGIQYNSNLTVTVTPERYEELRRQASG